MHPKPSCFELSSPPVSRLRNPEPTARRGRQGAWLALLSLWCVSLWCVTAEAQAPSDADSAQAAVDADSVQAAVDADSAQAPSDESEVAGSNRRPSAVASPTDGDRASPAELSAPTPTATGVASAPPPRADPFWEIYHQATLALADEERERAVALLRQIPATHPAASEAHRLLDRLAPPEEPPTRSGERRSVGARVELAARQTLQGLGAGSMLCLTLDCDGARFGGVVGVGMALGLGLSLGLSRDGVTPGQAALYSALPRWSYINGLLLFSALGVNFEQGEFDGLSWRPQAVGGTLLLSHALSLGAAAAVDFTLSPTAGDIAIMDVFLSTAWAVTLSLYRTAGPLDELVDGREGVLQGLTGGLLAVNAVALTSAALLTRRVSFSRLRAFLIQLGAAGGFGLGFGLIALIEGDDFSTGRAFGTAAAGMVGGFALSYWLSERVDRGGDDEASSAVQLSISPSVGGATAAIQGRF